MEYWDIYDKDKKPTGRTMLRNDWQLKDGEYHLTVLGVVHRISDGKFLITKRVMTKAWAPGAWEVSGGACQAGETSYGAVKREVKEETGLDISSVPEEKAYVFTYSRENPGKGDNYFVDVYRFDIEFEDGDVHPQVEETDGFRMADVQEIRSLAAENNFLHYDSIRRVFNMTEA